MNNFDLTKFLAEGKLLKENLSSRAEELEMDFMDPRNKFGDEWQEQVSNVLVRKYDGHWENWENENPKELEMLLNKFKNLAEGKLHEALDPQDIVDIADTVAEEFTKEDADGGIFMVYSVGKMDADDMTFELDTDTTSQTPERILNMSNLGVGEGWGGSFRIKPKGEGYEVRNTEKGGLVAIIDNMGSFRMISNDEAKAEMDRAKGEETDFMQNRKEMDDYAMDENKEIKSNKMTKSKLKEMIKAAMVGEGPIKEEEEFVGNDINANKLLKIFAEYLPFNHYHQDKTLSYDEALDIATEFVKFTGMDSTGADFLNHIADTEGPIREAEDVEVTDDEDVDIDIEKDVKVDDEESEVDIDINAELPGEDGDVTEVLALLMKSQQAAEGIGDEKLMDQIGNTITYFTRSHVANVNEADLDMDLDSAAGRAKEATIGLDETEELDEKKQGYNDELDDSEGAKHGKKKQSMAQRRADSENMEKAAGKRKYSGDKSKDLNESVTFPMWNKIK